MSIRRAAKQVPLVSPTPHPPDPSRGLLTVLTLVLAFLWLLPTLVSFAPDIYFDVDPRSAGAQPLPITVLSPTAAMVLHTLVAALSAVVLAVHGGMGHRLRRGSLALGLLGLALAAGHLGGGVEATLRAAMWCAGVCAALAVLHLAQHERPRRILLAAAIAMLIPQLIDTLLYVWFEHPATVQNFLENEAQTLQARGWVHGSPQHLLFKRRLMFADATGPFGLSNVFGSVIGAMTLLAVGVALSAAVRKQWHRAAGPGLAALAGAVVLALTHSKGAPLAAVMALSLAPVLLWVRHRGGRPRWLPGVAALLLVLAAIAVIPMRGSMGPPDTAEGERSLLFRWHYWQGAAGIIADEPARLLRGVGPTGFKELYSRFKNPLNPEEVTSTHNVFLDFGVLLGAAGIAWSAMLVLWLWQAAVGAGQPAPPPQPDRESDVDAEPKLAVQDSDLRLAAVVGLCLFVAQFVITFPTQLTPEAFVGWCAAVMLFVVLMALLLSPGWTWPRGGGKIGLALAATMLLVHAQIEMTFFHDGATTVALVLLAAAAGAAAHAARRPAAQSDRLRQVAPALLLGVVAAMLAIQAARVSRHQKHLHLAADALRVNQPGAALEDLARALAVLPRDTPTWRTRITLMMEWADAAGRMGRHAEARDVLQRLLVLFDQAQAVVGVDSGLLRYRARAQEMAAAAFNDPQRLGAAIADWQALLRHTPYSLQDTLALADLLWRLDRRGEAAQQYRRALELDRQSYLDPAKQLDESTRRLVHERLGEPPP